MAKQKKAPTKTNPVFVALAEDFLGVMTKEIPKYRQQFNKLAYNYNVGIKEDREDIFYDTLIRCYNSISKYGFTKDPTSEHNGYSVYFTTALRHSTLKFKDKRAAERAREDYHYQHESEARYDDEEHYLMMVRTVPVEDVIEAGDDSEPETENDEVEEMYADMIKNIRLKNAFLSLPAELQEVIGMRYHKLTYLQISRILSIPITTVKMRLYTGRNKLKQKLYGTTQTHTGSASQP